MGAGHPMRCTALLLSGVLAFHVTAEGTHVAVGPAFPGGLLCTVIESRASAYVLLDRAWLTFFAILYWAGLTSLIMFNLFRYLINLRRKRPAYFPLWPFALLPMAWLLIVNDYQATEDSPEVQYIYAYIFTIFWGTYYVILFLCGWIDSLNRQEFRRRKEETPSPPSPLAT
jgi:hypothetical protein